jgi:hypothetical protein
MNAPVRLGFHGFSALTIVTSGSLSAPVAMFGTAIAAIRVPSEIVVAADSRVVDGYGRRMPDEYKIRVVIRARWTGRPAARPVATRVTRCGAPGHRERYPDLAASR